jgi:hypothetical protein
MPLLCAAVGAGAHGAQKPMVAIRLEGTDAAGRPKNNVATSRNPSAFLAVKDLSTKIPGAALCVDVGVAVVPRFAVCANVVEVATEVRHSLLENGFK